MFNLLTRGQYFRQKPPAGTPLDMALARQLGMILCYTFSDIVKEGTIKNIDIKADPRTLYATVTGGLVNKQSKWGIGYELDTADGTNYVDLGSPGSELALPTNTATVMMGYRKTDTTLRASSAFGLSFGNEGSVAFGAHIPYSDGVVYWDFGGIGEGATRLSIGGLTFGDDIWAFTTGLRGMEIWQNGILRASNAANPSRAIYNGTSVRLGMHNSVLADLAVYTFFYVWTSQLPHGFIQRLSRYPWSIFADLAPARRRFVGSVGAAPPPADFFRRRVA